jgi:hypothetical protein
MRFRIFLAVTWAMFSDDRFSDVLDLKDSMMGERMHTKALNFKQF